MEDEPEMEPVAFREVQRFRQTWVWVVTLLLCIPAVSFMLWSLYQQLVLGKPVGDNPTSDEGLVILTIMIFLFVGVLLWLIGFAALTTEVTSRGIRARFVPFHRKWREYPREKIENIRVGTYRPIADYGGWGIRLGMKGWAYNVSGNQGMEIHFRNGKTLLIGTQRPAELALAAGGIGIEVQRSS